MVGVEKGGGQGGGGAGKGREGMGALAQLGMVTGQRALEVRAATQAGTGKAEGGDERRRDGEQRGKPCGTPANMMRAWAADVVAGGIPEITDDFLTLGEPAYKAKAFRNPANFFKNRYPGLECRDESRVILGPANASPTNRRDDKQAPRTDDYIHASWVDGLRPKEFILTQAPTVETMGDLWEMVWQEGVGAIVMISGLVEGEGMICPPYWPATKGKSMEIRRAGQASTSTGSGPGPNAGLHHEAQQAFVRVQGFKVTTMDQCQYHLGSAQYKFVRSLLWLEKWGTGRRAEGRKVLHYAWLGWGEKSPPLSGLAVACFMERVRREQRSLGSGSGGKPGKPPSQPPLVIHCSDGVNRSGTLCLLDTAWRRLLVCGWAPVRDMLYALRTQRAHAIQRLNDYIYVYFYLLDNLLEQKLLKSPQAEAAETLRHSLRAHILHLTPNTAQPPPTPLPRLTPAHN